MIIEKSVNGIKNIPMNVKKKSVPQSTNKSLPLLFNTQLYIGSKGTGKSYKLTQLLKFYEKDKFKDENGLEYEMRTILICPTASSGANEVYKILESLDEDDIHLEYTDQLVLDILDDIKNKQKEYENYIEYKKIYDRFVKLKSVSKLDNEELEILESHDFMSPKEVFGDIKPKINFLIFDDLVGMGAFNKKSRSVLSNLVIKHRHLKCNLIFTTQSYKQIPPVIRNNIDIYAIFRSNSYKEILERIYEDLSGMINLDDFFELYQHATDERNDALIIVNNSMDKNGASFFKNWDKELIINK